MMKKLLVVLLLITNVQIDQMFQQNNSDNHDVFDVIAFGLSELN